MRNLLLLTLVLLSVPMAALPADAQTPSRESRREQLRSLLASAGGRADVNVQFQPVRGNEWNFTGTLTTGLTHAESLEVVFSIAPDETIKMLVYPRYKGGYINIDKAQDRAGLTRHLLLLSYRNYLFWGIDNDNDAFAGFTFTLESGFPDAAMVMVLRAIPLLDGFVGQLRPFIDGSSLPK
jgi:hypothetical protein